MRSAEGRATRKSDSATGKGGRITEKEDRIARKEDRITPKEGWITRKEGQDASIPETVRNFVFLARKRSKRKVQMMILRSTAEFGRGDPY
jgi:hypothetical protein